MAIKSILLSSAILILSSSAFAAPYNTELVLNGGAESGDTSGWISTGGIEAVTAIGPQAGFGAFAFTGGPGPVTQTLLQTIDISANSAQVDAGTVESLFSIQLQSRADGSLTDTASVSVTFENSTGTTLDSFLFSDTTSALPYDWNFFTDTRLIPVGTRSIEILLIATRNGGDSSDGFFDEVSLKLKNTSAVPVPAAVWLFGSGLLALAGVARRKMA